MKVLARILIVAFPAIIVSFWVFHRGKVDEKKILENLKKEHIVIKLPRSLFWLGFFGCAIFCVPIICMALSKDKNYPLWIYIGFAFFIVLYAYIILFTLLWRIDIFRSEDYFIIRTALFRTHKIRYSDCVGYKSEKSGIKLKTKDKTFEVTVFANNYEFLLIMLDENNVKEIE
ncbi:MAG: hypothetical protein IKZ81_07415 [Clostridia bacterium]|nr:hypothetical protein [Clostridia bacterium]